MGDNPFTKSENKLLIRPVSSVPNTILWMSVSISDHPHAIRCTKVTYRLSRSICLARKSSRMSAQVLNIYYLYTRTSFSRLPAAANLSINPSISK